MNATNKQLMIVNDAIVYIELTERQENGAHQYTSKWMVLKMPLIHKVWNMFQGVN